MPIGNKILKNLELKIVLERKFKLFVFEWIHNIQVKQVKRIL